MNDLANIPGIDQPSLELLEAAGFLNARSLASLDSAHVAAELRQANDVLKIVAEAPSEAEVIQWIGHAREIAGVEMDAVPAHAPEQPVPEDTAEEPAVLATAALAIPLPARVLMDHNLAVADIPPALPLNHHAGDAVLRGANHQRENRAPVLEGPASKQAMIADNVGRKRLIDTSRVRSIDRPPQDDREPGVLRELPPSTMEDHDPKSRHSTRGVQHNNPMGVYLGSLATLLLMLNAPLAAVSAILLLLSSEVPDRFSWVPEWVIVFPLALPAFGMAYLVLALRCKCRICGQGFFHKGMHTSNSKAHHIRGLGYVFPLCIHIVFFQWFRCMQCGTPVRLRE